MVQETPPPVGGSPKSPGWFGKKKPAESTHKLVFSFSKESDPDFLNEEVLSSPDFGSPITAGPPKNLYQRKDDHPTDFSAKNRKTSEYSLASIPVMVFEGADDHHVPPTENTGSSIVDSGHKMLQVQKALGDRQDSTSMRSFRSDTNTVISSGKELEEEKLVRKQRFWDFLTMVLSMSYAIIVVMTGIAIYAYDVLINEDENTTVSAAFNLFLCIVGISWLCYLVYDINRYIHEIEGHARGSLDLGEMKLVEGEDGELHIEMSLPGEKKTVPEYYGFASGRHSGSFYLKIGAGVFCIGHVVHMGLNFVKEIIFTISDIDDIHELCSSYMNACVDMLTPIYSIIQCFVIFKYGNVIVNKNKWLARFAFMHCISASLCLWIYTIVNETLDALVVKNFYKPKCDHLGEDHDDHHFRKSFSWVRDDNTSDELRLGCLKEELSMTEHFECVLELKYFCAASNQLSDDLFNFASLLYPFSIEFSILVVGVWYILWSNIAKIEHYKDSLNFLPSVTPRGSVDEGQRTEGHKQAMILFADCSSSNKGLFLGIVLLVLTIIGGIVVLMIEDPCDYSTSSTVVVVSNLMESIILVICIIASIM